VHGDEVLRELAARRGRQVTLPVVFSSGLGSTSADASELLTGLGRTAYAISQAPHVLHSPARPRPVPAWPAPHGDPAAAAAVAQVLFELGATSLMLVRANSARHAHRSRPCSIWSPIRRSGRSQHHIGGHHAIQSAMESVDCARGAEAHATRPAADRSKKPPHG
jgi:hypothetical protein